MIQDIYPHTFHNQFSIAREPVLTDRVIHFRDKKEILVAGEDDDFAYPQVKDFPDNGKGLSLTYLFSIDDTGYYMSGTNELPVPEGFGFRPLTFMRRKEAGPLYRIMASYTAFQLINWYHDNRFCGTCGSETEHSTTERALVCPKCHRTIYPRIIPAVIVAVTNGDEIVVTRYANRGLPFYALIAGFTEIGETLEETVQREVMEEVGLKVKNIRYYKSQPWGIVDDLLMGFFCDVDGDPTITLDRTELKEGIWLRREEVILQPNALSLTNEMMTVFKEGREPR